MVMGGDCDNVSDLGKIIVATSFEWLPKVQKIANSGHTASKPLVFVRQEKATTIGRPLIDRKAC